MTVAETYTPSKPLVRAGWKFHAGLFLTTLSLLNMELLLTRIFSVTMWYHFAFMAISLAMFGLAAGAVFVELRQLRQPGLALTRTTTWFSLSSVVCFILQLFFPSDPSVSIAFAVLAFLLTAIPFLFAGVAICIALTSFPGQTRTLYAADLAGSAAGCLLFVPLLNILDAPSAVILNAAIAGLAGVFFLQAQNGDPIVRLTRRRAKLAAGICALIAIVNGWTHWIDVRYAKGGLRWGKGLYQQWNALSRIHIMKFGTTPFGWGLSSTYKPDRPVDQLYLNIDGAAGTVITKYDGDPKPLNYLAYDITSLGYNLRPARSALVIGVGGGRDVLTALYFGEKRIVGVEINDGILNALRGRFADYAGGLARIPGVTLVHDEARSFVTRSPDHFAVIQASLVDTWAATAAGSYVLSENGLYTIESWTTFLNHLDDDGILSVSRWYYEKQPAETLRLASLAREALTRVGAQDPRQNIVIVRKRDSSETGEYSVATLLVCRRPFTKEEIDGLEALSTKLDFVPVLTPTRASPAEFASVVDPQQYRMFLDSYPLNLSAPDDDSPFFFHMMRSRDLLKAVTQGMNQMNVQAVKMLLLLIGITVFLSLVILAIPWFMSGSTMLTAQRSTTTAYFASIGVAFILMEIGQLERFTVFLGHPTYGMTVVLFSLLVASSCGSASVRRMGRWLWLSVVVFALVIYATPAILSAATASTTMVRILIAVGLLSPAGFFMGMYLPLGMERARGESEHAPLAWYWAVNGACSVTASVLAIMISMFASVTRTLWLALGAYLIALLLLRSRNPVGVPGAKAPGLPLG